MECLGDRTLDVFAAAGDVQDNTEMISSRKSRQQNLLLLNDGHGAFRAAFAGPPAMNRGAFVAGAT